MRSKRKPDIMPKASFTITGDIKDFTRIDNVYRSMKNEAKKLLTKWTIDFRVEYTEEEGEIETP